MANEHWSGRSAFFRGSLRQEIGTRDLVPAGLCGVEAQVDHFDSQIQGKTAN